MKVTDLAPDPTRPGIPDVLARNLFFRGALRFTFLDAVEGDEQSRTVTSTLRIRDVWVGDVEDSLHTVQVQVNGRAIFDDADLPQSGLELKQPTYPYVIKAGSQITVILQSASNAPQPVMNVNIITEPTTLLPRTEQRELRGKDKLRTSKRRDVAASNRGVDVSPLFPTAVNVPYPTGPGVTGYIQSRLIRVRGQDIHFRPRRTR